MRAVLALAAIIALVVIGLVFVPVRGCTEKKSPAKAAGDPHIDRGNLKAKGPATLTIKSRIGDGAWTKAKAVYPLKGQSVTLRIDPVRGGKPRWFQIVPDVSKYYKNANFPWDPEPYKWIGLSTIDYYRRELPEFRGQWEIEPFQASAAGRSRGKAPSPTTPVSKGIPESSYYHGDVGSFWFQVEVEKGGKTFRSRGIEDSDKRGLSPRVLRVSIRDGAGYPGYLTTFFNVPGVFGSVPYQSNNYIGVDCCDVLVAAYGKWKGIPIKKNYSVSMLVTHLPKRTEFEISYGKPNRSIEWGKDVRRGDLIAVKYKGARSYQHIGALYSDADQDGFLSVDDIILHAGPQAPAFVPLGEGSFDGHAAILEPRFSKLLR